MSGSYTEEDIKTLNWREHIRLRPGMYIGKLGDGAVQDDGIYLLLKGLTPAEVPVFYQRSDSEACRDLHEGLQR